MLINLQGWKWKKPHPTCQMHRQMKFQGYNKSKKTHQCLKHLQGSMYSCQISRAHRPPYAKDIVILLAGIAL